MTCSDENDSKISDSPPKTCFTCIIVIVFLQGIYLCCTHCFQFSVVPFALLLMPPTLKCPASRIFDLLNREPKIDASGPRGKKMVRSNVDRIDE